MHLKKIKFNRQDLFFYLVLISGLVLIYGHLIPRDAFIDFDDHIIFSNFDRVKTFSEYLDHVQKGLIPDVQPVRDFFSWMNFQLLHRFGYGFFHITNLLTFITLIAGLRKGMNLLFEYRKKSIDLFLLAVAFSPLYVSSVAWLSSRKHLLSATFIVWASVALIRFIRGEKKQWIWMTLLFTLSVFSQPINLLWPIFAWIILVFYGKKREWIYLTPSFVVAGIAGLINLKYYDTTYLWISGGFNKYARESDSGLGASYLVYGRYFFQVLIPYWTGIGEYGYVSWQNIFGLALIAPYYYLLYKFTDLKKPLVIFSAFTLGLFPVIWKITHRFGTDTYLVSASIPILIGLYMIISRIRINPRIGVVLVLSLITTELSFSHTKAAHWDNVFILFKEAFYNEPSFMNHYRYVSWLMTNASYQEVFDQAVDLYEKYPDRIGSQNLVARMIAIANITPQEKINLMARFKFTSRTAGAMVASFEHELGHFETTYDILSKIEKTHVSLNGVGYGCTNYADLWKSSCEKLKRKDCANIPKIVANKCDETINL